MGNGMRGFEPCAGTDKCQCTLHLKCATLERMVDQGARINQEWMQLCETNNILNARLARLEEAVRALLGALDYELGTDTLAGGPKIKQRA